MEEDQEQCKEMLHNIKAEVLKNAGKNIRSLVVKEDTAFYMWRG